METYVGLSGKCIQGSGERWVRVRSEFFYGQIDVLTNKQRSFNRKMVWCVELLWQRKLLGESH